MKINRYVLNHASLLQKLNNLLVNFKQAWASETYQGEIFSYY